MSTYLLPIRHLPVFLLLLFTSALLPAQALQWLTSTNKSVGRGITSDALGNTYILGQFTGAVDFDPGPGISNGFTGANDYDIYLQKLNPNGDLVWFKTVGGSNLDEPFAIEMDSQDSPIIVGYSLGGLDFSNVGLGSFPNKRTFVWKLDSAGNSQWVKAWSATQDVKCVDIGITAQDEIYVTGHFEGVMDMNPGGGVVNDTANFRSPFLIKLDGHGVYQGALIFDSNVGAEANKLVVDPAGIYLTGIFQGDLDADPGVATTLISNPSPGFDTYFLKIDHAGNLKWAEHIDTGTSEEVQGLETDGSGNVYISTIFEGTIDCDPSPTGTALQTAEPFGVDALIIKLDSNGQYLNAGAVKAYGNNQFRATEVDSAGNIFVSVDMVATHYLDIALGQDTIYEGSSTQSGGLVIKYAPDFSILWIGKHAGDALGYLYAYDIHLAQDGGLLATGVHFATMDLDPEDSVQNFNSSQQSNTFAYRLRCTTGHSYAQYALCDSLNIFGQTFTESGLHHFHIPGGQGCDSVITATISILAPTVWDNGLYLNTEPIVQAQYQWLYCDSNYAPIPGATQVQYQYPGDGSYAVAVTANGCTDTSECYVINTVAVVNGLPGLKIAQLREGFRVLLPGLFQATLIDLQGRMLAASEARDEATFEMSGFPAGVYLVRVLTEAGVASRKVVWMGQ